jgi:hypothetical protein
VTCGTCATAFQPKSPTQRYCSRPCARRALANRTEDAWKRVDRRGDNECWPWLGTIDGDGYGRMFVRCKNLLAHRLIYRLATGTDPGELLVCHTCDNRRCCNPAHLFLGTPADNSRDMAEKGRASRAAAKLTLTDVRHVRALYDGGWDRRDIALVFGVTPTNVSTIGKRLTWRHV